MQNETEAPPASTTGAQGGNPSDTSQGSMTGGVASSAKNIHDNLTPMGEHSSFNFALALAWIVALLAIVATLYFWWISKNTVDIVTDKQTKLESIEEQIKAPAMVKAEKDSTDFKTSVGILSKAKKDRFSITEFLPSFYTKITNDVKITSLSLSADGSLSIAGTTKTYRTTADLVMALKSWSKLSDVELTSVSMSTGSDKNATITANFSVSAKVVKTPVVAASTGATDSNLNTNTNSTTDTSSSAASTDATINSNTNSSGGVLTQPGVGGAL